MNLAQALVQARDSHEFGDNVAGKANTYEELLERLRMAEEALQRSERLAVASRFAGAVMHEVNNPLEALTNLVYITKRAPHDRSAIIRNMEIAEAQLARLSEITRTTLSFYREQAEAKDFDLVEIAQSALMIHSRRAQRQKVDIRKEMRGPATARGFAGEILQVISNLILNALDAVPETGGILTLRVKTLKGKVHISVADNGSGIAPAMSKVMFQAHQTTKSNGTGLGLWLSKGIAERHDGTITYRQGKTGTTFRLTLPMSQILAKV
ncbi:MAG TPA: HAMP domain-containing sensor histidine kinase [Candidatus Sulfotelmatobacter sp.]